MDLGFSADRGAAEMLADAPAIAVPAEQTARHFARELHDQIGQPLVGVLLELGNLKLSLAADDPVVDQVSRLEDSVRQVLRHAREMMVDPRGGRDQRINLAKALQREIAPSAGRNLSLNVTSRWPAFVNGWAGLNVLRIVQEAVANAWRHGRAHRVDVVLDVGPSDQAIVVVMDDGVGIADAPNGLGMVGMQERAAILGGSFSARPREPRGTRVEVRVPVARLA